MNSSAVEFFHLILYWILPSFLRTSIERGMKNEGYVTGCCVWLIRLYLFYEENNLPYRLFHVHDFFRILLIFRRNLDYQPAPRWIVFGRSLAILSNIRSEHKKILIKSMFYTMEKIERKTRKTEKTISIPFKTYLSSVQTLFQNFFNIENFHCKLL